MTSALIPAMAGDDEADGAPPSRDDKGTPASPAGAGKTKRKPDGDTIAELGDELGGPA
jgi:hypothetical protein